MKVERIHPICRSFVILGGRPLKHQNFAWPQQGDSHLAHIKISFRFENFSMFFLEVKKRESRAKFGYFDATLL